MGRWENLKQGASVRGVLPEYLVTFINAQMKKALIKLVIKCGFEGYSYR